MNEGSFTEWWAENKDSEILAAEYQEACLELKQMGEKACSFKKWAREQYESLEVL